MLSTIGASLLKVSFLGSRGIAIAYGGYETLVEELATGLAKIDGMEVKVYCRSTYYDRLKRPETFRGVKLVYLPAPRIKAIESLLHSFLSTVHQIFCDEDVVYFVDPANAPFCLLLRFLGWKVVIHTNGLGWKRTKWGTMARRYYKFVEWLCAKTASALVTDNPAMTEYYTEEYDAFSSYIPYGATNKAGFDDTVYEDFHLVPSGYFLVVARLEPENNTDFIIKEYVKTCAQKPLVIVGDSPYDLIYMQKLRSLADDRVLFTGRISDQAKLNSLYKGAYVYIHGHEVGGTNPSLLRAMGVGTAPAVLDVPFNTTIISDSGYVFNKRSGALKDLIDQLIRNPDNVKEIGQRTQIRTSTHFRWTNVVQKHLELFSNVLRK